MTPALTSSTARRMAGLNFIHIASMRKTFDAAAIRPSASASSAVMVNGFSQTTCLPASRAWRAYSKCVVWGVPM